MCADRSGQQAGADYDTHHIVLDFGSMPFPVLEGQSIGIIPPGTDDKGRAHHARSTASPARATASAPATTTCRSPSSACSDHGGQAGARRGSNYMCDLKVGDKVQVIGRSVPVS